MFEKLKDQLTNKASRTFALASALVLGEAALPSHSASEAKGGLLHNITANYNDSHLLALNPMYKWAAAIERVDHYDNAPSVTGRASGFLIAPDLYIDAGHYTPRDGSQVAFHTKIMFGANYNTPSAEYEIDRTQRFPGYVFGDTNTIDLGVGWTKEFVDGFDTPITFADANIGEMMTMAEYGDFGDSNIGIQTSIGDKLAVRAPVFDDVSSPYPNSMYFATRFSDNPFNTDPLNGRGLGGSSGAPVFNANGELVGLHVAGTIGVGLGADTNLRILHPDVQAFLQPLIQDSWARYEAANTPEPTTFATVAFGVTAASFIRRRREES